MLTDVGIFFIILGLVPKTSIWCIRGNSLIPNSDNLYTTCGGFVL